jgi:protein TonB
MLAQNPKTELLRQQAVRTGKQPRQMQIALVLLLAALAILIATNRDFWFGTDEARESDTPRSETISKAYSVTASPTTCQTPVAPPAAAKKRLSSQNAAEPSTTAPSPNASANRQSPVVATRTLLPPLEVEVVAGDAHRTLHPGSNSTNVEIGSGSHPDYSTTTSVAALPANAAGRERLSPVSGPALRQTVEATYPLLGQHASVQGSVVLQAVIGTDGTIVTLRILSGPAILTAAAQQAVRQWRFKPYLQNGQLVETKARITVNFSIKISDNPAKTS